MIKGDIFDVSATTTQLADHDILISAFNSAGPSQRADMIQAQGCMVESVKASKISRFISIGGAGSLYVSPGVQLIETGQVPEEYMEAAHATCDGLKTLQQETEIVWTVLSPSAMLEPGEKTNNFRIGKDDLLMNGDLAAALVDEVEQPKHLNARFTVGY